MAKISDAQVRRLLSHLKSYVDEEQLAEIENELRGNDAEEFLREPDLLKHFPELSDEFMAAGKSWKLRVIPHAHLRMVQRGVKLNDVSNFFRSFAELYTANERPIFIGHYAFYGRMKARNLLVTLRVDVSSTTDEKGDGHAVTVYMGRGNNEGMTEIDLPF